MFFLVSKKKTTLFPVGLSIVKEVAEDDDDDEEVVYTEEVIMVPAKKTYSHREVSATPVTDLGFLKSRYLLSWSFYKGFFIVFIFNFF